MVTRIGDGRSVLETTRLFREEEEEVVVVPRARAWEGVGTHCGGIGCINEAHGNGNGIEENITLAFLCCYFLKDIPSTLVFPVQGLLGVEYRSIYSLLPVYIDIITA